MTSFSERLAKAENAPKPHRDVDLHLDDDTAERINALEAELETVNKDKRLGDARAKKIEEQIAAVEAEAADSLVVIRFHRMPATEWAEIVGRSPMRLDVPVDRMYGYNVHDAAKTAAPASGVLITRDGDEEHEEPILDEDWDRLFQIVSGRDFTRIVDAIFELNDYGPQQRLDAARKASRAGIGATSS